jgi:hypothetical protein
MANTATYIKTLKLELRFQNIHACAVSKTRRNNPILNSNNNLLLFINTNISNLIAS